MINRYVVTFFLFLMCFAGNTSAFSLLNLQEKLATQTLVRGQYTQTKNMQMFNQPLLSHGDFVLQQQQGLLWLQKKPFSVTLVLTKDKLSQQFDNQPPQVIGAADNPMVFYFSHLFLSMFKGDIEGLTNQFDLDLQGDAVQWVLLLIPKSAPLDKIFKEITISGSKYIDQLNLIELNGDSSEIHFINQNNLPNNLSDHEQHSFQL